MSVRTILLGIVGLAIAVTVGLAANAISRDSIGLAPSPAGTSVPLSPPKASTAEQGGRPARTPTRKQPTTTPTTPAGSDDHGGDRNGGGSGGSGGSGSSGSGSGGSGHGGSSSGHGGSGGGDD
jgi:uncharacterized membrane protein YgcG